MSPPPAYSPGARDDTEVLSRRTAPKGGAQDVVREAPQGETSTAGHMGEPIPMETGEEGRISFGPQPNTIPETRVAPESGEHLLLCWLCAARVETNRRVTIALDGYASLVRIIILDQCDGLPGLPQAVEDLDTQTALVLADSTGQQTEGFCGV